MHCGPKRKGKNGGQDDYADFMCAHDENIGRMLAKLDELGITGDTIVMYSTNNGPHHNSWPDPGITLERADTRAQARQDQGWLPLNDIASHQDWLPALLAVGTLLLSA